MKGFTVGTHFISRAMRDLIEKWDPGHCAYVPITLHLADGRVLEDSYFYLRFLDFIDDGLIPEESDISPNIIKGRLRFYSTSQRPKLTWHAEKIAGRHVWADKYLKNRFCVSGAFLEAMEAQGITDGYRKFQSFVK